MRDDSSTRSDRWKPSPGMVAICTALAILVFVGVVFSASLTAGFVNRDDRHYVDEVGRIWAASWQNVPAAFGSLHFPSDTGGFYQPLTTLSLMLDAHLVGDYATRTFQFHFTNLILHLLNTALLLVLVRRLSRSIFWAAIAALLFALHPLQVESVAWVAQRMTLLATFFSLAAFYCYLRYVSALTWARPVVRKSSATRSRARRPLARPWLVAVLVLYAAAVLSKPTFIGLPVVFLILDVWPFRRTSWRPITEKLPLFVLMCVVVVVQVRVQALVEPVRTVEVGGLELIARNIASFASRIFWPVRLAPFYPFDTAAGSGLWVLADAALVVFLSASLVWSLRRNPPLFVALAGTVVLILPAFLQLPFTDQLLGDHYLYAALVMPAMAFGAWLATRPNPLLRRPWGRCLALVLAAVAMIFSVQSYAHSFVWHSSRTLYQYTIDLYPDWLDGYIELVEAFKRENDLDSALYYAEKAVQVDPDDASAQYYLGSVLLLHQAGRSSEAIEPLRKALASDPDWIHCLHDLGVALARNGHYQEAIGHLERARDLRPSSPDIRVGLGNAYLKVGRAASARREFQLALKKRNDPKAHLGLAIAWARNDQPDYARRHLAAALAKDRRLAARAARSPALRRLRHEPGFERLMNFGPDAVTGPEAAAPESPS